MNVRPIFLIHGVGSHKKGEFLSSVVEPWIQFLYRKLGSTNVSAQIDLRPEHGPANAVLEFENERWEIWEAHWHNSFYPLKSNKALLWGFMILYQHGWSMVKGLIPLFRGNPPYVDSTNAVYEKRPKPPLAWLTDRLIGWLAFALFLCVYPFTLALATVFFVLSQLPLGIVSQKLQQITARITDGLVEGPGDMAAILLSESRSLSIRAQLTELLCDKIPEGGLHATIVAHSAGTTVSTAVLTDPNLWNTWNETNSTPGSISFLTFGSSLNLAWQTAPDHKLWKMQPLDDRIRWIDFWARYDPIVHGPAILEMKEKVRGPGAGVFENVRVVNNDDPFSDHSGYWRNHSEVVSRIVYEAAQVTDATPELMAPIEEALVDIRRHRKHIGYMSLLRGLGGFGLLGVLILLDVFTAADPVSSFGHEILELIMPPEESGGGFGNWVLQLQENNFVHWLVGVAGSAAGLYTIWQIFRLWVLNPYLNKNY